MNDDESYNFIISDLPSGLPKLVQASPTDDQSGIDLQTVCAKSRVLEKLYELQNVSLEVNVGQIWHHMGHHLQFKATINIFCRFKITLNPASLDIEKLSQAALAVCPLLVSLATSS